MLPKTLADFLLDTQLDTQDNRALPTCPPPKLAKAISVTELESENEMPQRSKVRAQSPGVVPETQPMSRLYNDYMVRL